MDAHSSLRRKIQEDSLPLAILKVRILGDQPCSLSREKPVQSALDSLPPFEGRHGPADPRNEWSGGQWQPSLLLLLVKMMCASLADLGELSRWLPLTGGPLVEAPGWRGQALASL